MNYFQPYSLPADQAILAAWDSQLAELAECPELVTALTKRRELFPSFAAYYAQLRALPRGTRRTLQRKLVRVRELASMQPEWQRKLASSLAGSALLLGLAQSATAATINVTTNVPDINDADGKCSLIEAIINANNDAATHPDCAAGDGADTIVLAQNSTHTLTHYYGPFSLAFLGMPVITGTLTIQGNGAKIVARSAGLPFTLISVGRSADVTLKHLTLEGGLSGAGGSGKLSIQNSTITRNGLATGYIPGHGHFRGRGVFNSGTLIISNSIIAGNASPGGADPDFTGIGAGVRNDGVAYIHDSIISDNSANGGGGVANNGTLTIKNTTISGNTVHTMTGRFMRVRGGFGGG